MNVEGSNSLADLATRIEIEHAAAISAFERGFTHAVAAGGLLREAKAKIGHGEWLAWLASHCSFSERTAQAYMRAARELTKLEPAKAQRVAHLSFRQALKGMAASKTISGKAEAIEAAAQENPDKYRPLLDEMEDTGSVDRPFKLLTVARAREAYAARREEGGRVEDLVALAASGYRAGAILADPPWKFETFGDGGKVWTSAANHYQEMTVEEVAAFGGEFVLPLAGDDCLLFLWATWPHVATGRIADVIRRWGFEPTTLGFDWLKQNPDGEGWHVGNGYWTRSNSEVCLLGTRGSPLRLDEGVHQVILSPVGEHSAKPEETHTRIEALINGPYLELFGRKQQQGWTVWGDETPRLKAAE